jgi:DNA polymerase
LEQAFHNPDVKISCWNCSFERNITKWILGVDLPFNRFEDVMIQARYVSLPGSLGECGKALNLPSEFLKIDEGTELKNMFCFPAKEGGQDTLFGISQPLFRDSESNPKEWERFCDYCIHDVISERAISNKLKDFPLPEYEQKLFELDQEINERGVYVDSDLVSGGAYIAETVKGELLIRLAELTKLENPNSRDQMLEWVQKNGYTFHSLGKPFVMRALAGECPLTPECKEVLEIRQQSSKTSASKLVGIKNQLNRPMVEWEWRMKHDLIVICIAQETAYEENVVRWCKNCGAIVVDTDFDNRTKPGDIVPMMLPKGGVCK